MTTRFLFITTLLITNLYLNKSESMIPAGYIISVTVSDSNREVMPTVHKITGGAEMLFGLTKDALTTNLFIMPAGNKSSRELTTGLEAVPGFNRVSVVDFSKPIKGAELSEVRKIFASVDMDAGNVTDDKLSMFIDSKLEGQYTYYINRDHNPNEKGMFNMNIKLLTEHPQFSPDWLKATSRKNEDGGIHVHEVTIEDIVEEIEEDEPTPPPPPRNLDLMTDAQIRRWLKKNDSRKLEDKDIEIKRSSEEVVVTIKFEGETEWMTCKIKKQG